MNKYLNMSLAMSLFLLGLGLGRSSILADLGRVHAGGDGATLSGVSAAGSGGGALMWEQIDDVLQLTVIGSDVAFLGAAVLSDPFGWPDFGSGESQILEGGEQFSLDLEPVEELTFYQLFPVGRLEGGLFRPCFPKACFPIRPPVPPPGGPEGHHVFASPN